LAVDLNTRTNDARYNGTLDERPLPQLFRDLSNDSMLLIRKEAELFRAETSQKIAVVERQAMVLGVGGVIAHVGVLALTAALILLLALAIPAWASALLVGLAYVGAGITAIIIGKNRLQRENLAPSESMRSVQTDARMVREAVR